MQPIQPARAALVLIDVQQVFHLWEEQGMARNNPQAESNIGTLIAASRAAGIEVIHIRHRSLRPTSQFHVSHPGHRVMDFARETGGETVLYKSVNSGFIGTGLEHYLRARAIGQMLVAGITTNHCVETTTRMAGNLGFDVKLVADAAYTFERAGPDGRHYSAQQLHDVSLANLNEEFAEIVTTREVLARITQAPAG
ncbi:MAG TPA: cysteine hydrolase family protein [Burkholderiaceae bacterium]